MAKRSVPRQTAPPLLTAPLLQVLDDAQSAVDYLRGLYSLKYELITERDSDNLAWFTPYFEGCIDGAIDATAAHIGDGISRAQEALKHYASATKPEMKVAHG
jgi:hypothetical protein